MVTRRVHTTATRLTSSGHRRDSAANLIIQHYQYQSNIHTFESLLSEQDLVSVICVWHIIGILQIRTGQIFMSRLQESLIGRKCLGGGEMGEADEKFLRSL